MQDSSVDEEEMDRKRGAVLLREIHAKPGLTTDPAYVVLVARDAIFLALPSNRTEEEHSRRPLLGLFAGYASWRLTMAEIPKYWCPSSWPRDN